MKIRFYAAILCTLAMLGGFTQVHAIGDDDIRFINLDKVFNDFYRTKLADAQLKDQVEATKAESKKLVESYEKLNTEFKETREKANNPINTEEKKDEYRQKAEELLIQIRDQESKIRRFEETSRKRVEDQGRRMRKRLVGEIQDKVREYAKDKGYKAVIDTSGQSLNGVSMVIFVDPNAEITNEIIALLNASTTTDNATP